MCVELKSRFSRCCFSILSCALIQLIKTFSSVLVITRNIFQILQYWTHQPTKQKAEYHLFAAKLDYESNSFRNIKAPLSL